MRFADLTPKNHIDAQLRRAKPRTAPTNSLPWGPALFGLSAFLVLQTLL